MSSQDDLKSLIQSFKYSQDVKSKGITKPKVKRPTQRAVNSPNSLPNLNPSLAQSLTVLFVGYNPGVESSIQQHHYAHHSNLFWKLFNSSRIIECVCNSREINIKKDPFLSQLVSKGASHLHDWDLLKYGIGFTDLVLRCTKRAEELSAAEKIANVPRLLEEFHSEGNGAKYIVLIGKGIWETIVKYIATELSIKFKLTKENFVWGKVITGKDNSYNKIIKNLYSKVNGTVYVFPSSSGLVASMKYPEKQQLWDSLAKDIYYIHD
ncbi:G/U mismatch-specific uracil DNA glycosylase [Spathaspora sp. JA1]|nr:G/U mismatch-specific uracil DNA glycosylase [Spathaspora sp. JA1]